MISNLLNKKKIKPPKKFIYLNFWTKSDGRGYTPTYKQWWAAILKNVSFKAIQIHNF